MSEQVDQWRDHVLTGLADLRSGSRDPELVHGVRVGLRRLEAFCELIGESDQAASLAQAASKLSRLRTLQVFDQYLAAESAPARDRRKIAKRTTKAWNAIGRKDALAKIEGRVRDAAGAFGAAERDHDRGRSARSGLLEELKRAAERPRRKRLHKLRLRIKTLRYQEELLAGEGGRHALSAALKRAQTVLGRYEERAAFKRLARRLDLGSSSAISKDWKRARKRARRVPEQLRAALRASGADRLHLVRGR